MHKLNKKIIPIIVIIVLITATIIYFSIHHDFYYSGTIEATTIDISSRLQSVISEKLVSEGQRVNENSILYKLSCEDIKLGFDILQKDFTRAERLFKTGSLSLESFEHLKNKFDDASLKLKWCDILSPINGIVLNTYREKGEWVSPGMKLLTIADLKKVWAFFYVEHDLISNLSIGQKVIAILPEAKKKFEGTIIKINSEAEFTPKNVQTRTERTRLVYGIKVSFDNEDETLKPGMTVEAKL